jgi:hypothetical protein
MRNREHGTRTEAQAVVETERKEEGTIKMRET